MDDGIVVVIFLACVLFWGDPDLYDALMQFLLK